MNRMNLTGMSVIWKRTLVAAAMMAVWLPWSAGVRASDGPTRAVEKRAPLTPSDADYLPLGVYWPGEYLFTTKGAIDWPRNEAALDDLAKHHVNAVWLTHRSAAETAQFARRAAKRGSMWSHRWLRWRGRSRMCARGDHVALIGRTLKAWRCSETDRLGARRGREMSEGQSQSKNFRTEK